jgi:hypothetical protein
MKGGFMLFKIRYRDSFGYEKSVTYDGAFDETKKFAKKFAKNLIEIIPMDEEAKESKTQDEYWKNSYGLDVDDGDDYI